MNAFTVYWKGNNWVVPPPNLIVKVIVHMHRCQARGTSVIPCWRSSFFWTSICPDGATFAGFVHEWVPIPELKWPCTTGGKGGNTIFCGRFLHFPLPNIGIILWIITSFYFRCSSPDGAVLPSWPPRKGFFSVSFSALRWKSTGRRCWISTYSSLKYSGVNNSLTALFFLLELQFRHCSLDQFKFSFRRSMPTRVGLPSRPPRRRFPFWRLTQRSTLERHRPPAFD